MQRAELALRLKEAVAAEARKRQVKAGKEHGRGQLPQKSAQPISKGETRDELAKMAGVSHDTIAKVEKIVAEAEPEVVEAARRGSMSINAAFRTIAPEPREAAPEPSEPTVDIGRTRGR